MESINILPFIILSSLPIFIVVIGLMELKKEKNIFLKKKATIFNRKISKYAFGLTVMIFYFIFVSVISIINALSFFQVLNISPVHLSILLLYEVLILMIYGAFQHALFNGFYHFKIFHEY